MDPPSRSAGMRLAPGYSSGAAAVRLPAAESFPPVDEHVVKPELTRDEMIRGRKVVASPALDPHGDRHFELDFVLRGSVADGYVGSTDLLTRVNDGSDFASDSCIRRSGHDPATGQRWLEEVAFEVVNEQSMREVTEKAEELVARGVRRVFAIFVKQGRVGEWSAHKGSFEPLERGSVIEDPTLRQPLRVAALLDAAEADNAVARALVAKSNPVIEGVKSESRQEGLREGRMEGLREGKSAALLAILEARGLAVRAEARACILACRDMRMLDRWIAAAISASSVDELLG